MFHKNAKKFNEQKVKQFDPKKGITKTDKAYSFAWNWEDKDGLEISFKKFLEDPKIAEIKTIVIGNYGEFEVTPKEVVDLLLENKDKLKNITGMFFGDITYEENECSWIENMDYGPLLQAFPNLEIFKVRGGNSLEFSFLDHQKLKTLIIETGGMPNTVFEAIAKADLPSLEHLELWLGSENYGFLASLELVASAYKGKNKENHLPALKYLGLRNSEDADKLVEQMKGDPILKRIETLDFSSGIMSNPGAKAILENEDMLLLKKIDLKHNFIANKLAKKLKDKFGDKIILKERTHLPLDIDTSSEDIYDYEMYIEVSE